MVDYRDPKNNKKKTMNFAKPVVDIAASSRSQAGAKLASWGCSLTEMSGNKNESFGTSVGVAVGRLTLVSKKYPTHKKN